MTDSTTIRAATPNAMPAIELAATKEMKRSRRPRRWRIRQPGIAGADPEFVGYFQHERIMALTARKSGPRMCGSKTRRIHLWQMAAGLSSRHRQTTIPPMLIVIPGALPALPVAAELAKLLPERAPRCTSGCRPAARQATCARTAAPPSEAWQLRARRPPARAGLPLGAGLGPAADTGPAPGRRAGLAGRAGAPGAGRGPSHAGRSDQMDLRAEESTRCTTPCGRCSTAPASRPSAGRAPLAPAPAQLAAGHRQPAGRGRPPLTGEAGRRNPSVAPAAQ